MSLRNYNSEELCPWGHLDLVHRKLDRQIKPGRSGLLEAPVAAQFMTKQEHPILFPYTV